MRGRTARVAGRGGRELQGRGEIAERSGSSSGFVGWRPRAADVFVASIRMRCLQPLAELQRRALPFELFDARHSGRYGAVLFAKSYDERSLAEATELRRRGCAVLFDLCDNHFHVETMTPRLAKRAAQLQTMLGLADGIVTSTPAMAEVLREHVQRPRPIVVVDDVVETALPAPWRPFGARWRATRELAALRAELAVERAAGRTPLVWFGVHGGPYARCGIVDLERIRERLHDVDARHPVSLTVVSNSLGRYHDLLGGWKLRTRYVEWHPATFLSVLREHAVCVVPITPSSYTRCKSANRPAQALAAGLAVVADSIPSYEPLRPYLRLDDWEAGLETYLRDPAARARDATAGAAYVRRRFSGAAVADQWQQAVAQIAATARCAVRLEPQGALRPLLAG